MRNGWIFDITGGAGEDKADPQCVRSSFDNGHGIMRIFVNGPI